MSDKVFRYPKGQRIPNHVIHALAFAGKTGFLSFDLWANCFAIGTDRWKHMQFEYLKSKGYLTRHRSPEARSTCVLGRRGRELVEELKGVIVTSPTVSLLTHDGVVAKSIYELTEKRIVRSWVGERQLKMQGAKQYLVSSKDDSYKYPDAIFKAYAYGSERTIALEYERERKSMSRYRSILFQYASLTNLSMVLFVCEIPNIRTTIKSAMKYLGQTSLIDRLAFTTAGEWKNDPANAKIELSNGVITLAEICTS